MSNFPKPATPNKTDAGNGSYGICRVSDASRSPSPDPGRSARKMKQPKCIFLFLLYSTPSFLFALSFITQVTPASMKSGDTPFEFVVTSNDGGLDVSFSASLRKDGSGPARAYLAICEITNGPKSVEPHQKGRLQPMRGERTRLLRDIALQEKDGKTFVEFHIEPELLKKENLSFVYEIPSNEGPVAGIYNFCIAAFLPNAEHGMGLKRVPR